MPIGRETTRNDKPRYSLRTRKPKFYGESNSNDESPPTEAGASLQRELKRIEFTASSANKKCTTQAGPSRTSTTRRPCSRKPPAHSGSKKRENDISITSEEAGNSDYELDNLEPDTGAGKATKLPPLSSQTNVKKPTLPHRFPPSIDALYGDCTAQGKSSRSAKAMWERHVKREVYRIVKDMVYIKTGVDGKLLSEQPKNTKKAREEAAEIDKELDQRPAIKATCSVLDKKNRMLMSFVANALKAYPFLGEDFYSNYEEELEVSRELCPEEYGANADRLPLSQGDIVDPTSDEYKYSFEALNPPVDLTNKNPITVDAAFRHLNENVFAVAEAAGEEITRDGLPLCDNPYYTAVQQTFHAACQPEFKQRDVRHKPLDENEESNSTDPRVMQYTAKLPGTDEEVIMEERCGTTHMAHGWFMLGQDKPQHPMYPSANMIGKTTQHSRAVPQFFTANSFMGIYVAVLFRALFPNHYDEYEDAFRAAVWVIEDVGPFDGHANVYKLQTYAHRDGLDRGPAVSIPCGFWTGGYYRAHDVKLQFAQGPLDIIIGLSGLLMHSVTRWKPAPVVVSEEFYGTDPNGNCFDITPGRISHVFFFPWKAAERLRGKRLLWNYETQGGKNPDEGFFQRRSLSLWNYVKEIEAKQRARKKGIEIKPKTRRGNRRSQAGSAASDKAVLST